MKPELEDYARAVFASVAQGENQDVDAALFAAEMKRRASMGDEIAMQATKGVLRDAFEYWLDTHPEWRSMTPAQVIERMKREMRPMGRA